MTHREAGVLEPSGAEGEQGVVHDITETLLQKHQRLSEGAEEERSAWVRTKIQISSVLGFGCVERVSVHLHIEMSKCASHATTTDKDKLLFQ